MSTSYPASHVEVKNIDGDTLAHAVREQAIFLYRDAPGKSFICGNEEKSPGGRVWFHAPSDLSGIDRLVDDALTNFENGLPAWLPLNLFTGTPIRHGRSVIFRANKNVSTLCAFGIDFDPLDHGSILDFPAVRNFIETRCDSIGMPHPSGYMIGRGVWALWLVTPCEATEQRQRIYKETRKLLRLIFRKDCAPLGCDVCANGGVSPCSVFKATGSTSDKNGITIRHRLEIANEQRHHLEEFSQTVANVAVPFIPIQPKHTKPLKAYPKKENTTTHTLVGQNDQGGGRGLHIKKLVIDLELARLDARRNKNLIGNARVLREQLQEAYRERLNRKPLWMLLHKRYRLNHTTKFRAAFFRVLGEVGHKVYQGGHQKFIRECARAMYYEGFSREKLYEAVESICAQVLVDVKNPQRIDEIVRTLVKGAQRYAETGERSGDGFEIPNEQVYEAMSLNASIVRKIIFAFPSKDRQRRSLRTFILWAMSKFPVLKKDRRLMFMLLKGKAKRRFLARVVDQYKEFTARYLKYVLENIYGFKRSIVTVRVYRQKLSRIYVQGAVAVAG